MLSLTDEELDTMRDMASTVPVGMRDAFLKALAKALEHRPAPYGVGTVHRAACAVAKEFLAPRKALEPVIDGTR